MTAARHSTGIPQLDQLLGGGLLPGTLTVVAGATGIGKTQLGVQYAHAGVTQEERAGVFFDLSARGDSQSHAQYADRLFQWQLRVADTSHFNDSSRFFERAEHLGDYLHLFDYSGRRVTRQDLEFEQWREWQSELNAKLQQAIGFLYGSFVSGRRRVVVDGIEPTGRPHDSVQFNLFEYIYHQVLRKDPQWVARDYFRQHFRQLQAEAARTTYDPAEVSCLLLITSSETMLDALIEKPLEEGDSLSNANTLIYMGKTRSGRQLGRGLYVAKHRGSRCPDSIIPYRIEDGGLVIDDPDC